MAAIPAVVWRRLALALAGRAVWYDPVEIVQDCGTCCGNLDHDPSAPALVLPVSAHHPPRPEATAAPDHLKNEAPYSPALNPDSQLANPESSPAPQNWSEHPFQKSAKRRRPAGKSQKIIDGMNDALEVSKVTCHIAALTLPSVRGHLAMVGASVCAEVSQSAYLFAVLRCGLLAFFNHLLIGGALLARTTSL